MVGFATNCANLDSFCSGRVNLAVYTQCAVVHRSEILEAIPQISLTPSFLSLQQNICLKPDSLDSGLLHLQC